MRIPVRRRSTGLSLMTAMTPMIDVVFNLLIFFVVSIGTSSSEGLLPADLLSSGNQPAPQTPIDPESLPAVEIWIRLVQETPEITRMELNGTPSPSLTDLRNQLKLLGEVEPGNPVFLQIGPDVPLAELIAVYDACQESGFESVNFATQSP